jgi:exopolysaccharide biosynthesis polyprenyl glycosylphosphotransferase
MTPHLGSRLTIHDPSPGNTSLAVRTVPQLGVPQIQRTRRLALVGDGDFRRISAVHRATIQRRHLAVADVLAATAALLFILTVASTEEAPTLATLAGMPLIVLVFKIAGLYDRDQLRIVKSTLDEVPLLLQLTGLYVLVLTIGQPLLIKGTLGSPQIAALWATSLAGIVAARIFVRWLSGRTIPLERCLVIGERARAERIREKFASSRARATVVATFPLEPHEDIDPLDHESVRRIVTDLGIHRIIIAPTTTDSGGVAELIRIVKAAGAQVSVLPRVLEVVGSAVEFEDIDGLTVLGVRPFGLARSSRLLKRAFDLTAASLGLISVAPIFAMIALAIRIDSKGPTFYRQVRVGREGRRFWIYKFRSMVVDADAQKERLRAQNEQGEGGNGLFKIDHDPRVTRIGEILRRTSLDELPQLLNVIRGEMSLVGPRPLVLDEDAQVVGLDRSRLHLTPGMTGPWQVLGARVPMQEMVGIDYLYVSSWSLWLDAKLLSRTVQHVLRGRNV